MIRLDADFSHCNNNRIDMNGFDNRKYMWTTWSVI